MLGAFLGAFFMQLLSTSLNLLNVNVYVQTLLTGAILILAILVDQLDERRKSARALPTRRGQWRSKGHRSSRGLW